MRKQSNTYIDINTYSFDSHPLSLYLSLIKINLSHYRNKLIYIHRYIYTKTYNNYNKK